MTNLRRIRPAGVNEHTAPAIGPYHQDLLTTQGSAQQLRSARSGSYRSAKPCPARPTTWTVPLGLRRTGFADTSGQACSAALGSPSSKRQCGNNGGGPGCQAGTGHPPPTSARDALRRSQMRETVAPSPRATRSRRCLSPPATKASGCTSSATASTARRCRACQGQHSRPSLMPQPKRPPGSIEQTSAA